MAKDILDAIRQAENDAKNRELKAKEDAQKRIDDAKAEAEKLIADAKACADKDAEERYNTARIDGDNELIKGTMAAETKCAQIKAAADSNRDSVVKNAVEFILS